MQILCDEAKDFCYKCYGRMAKYGYQCAFINKDNSYCGTILAINEDLKTLKRLQDINISWAIAKKER